MTGVDLVGSILLGSQDSRRLRRVVPAAAWLPRLAGSVPSVRILYTAVDTVVPGTDGGGVHVEELCRALAHRGHELHLAAPRVGQRGIDPADFALHRVQRPPRFLEWTAASALRALAERVRPDVVIDRFYTFGGAGIWAAHQLGIPRVLEVNSPARAYPGSWRDRLDRLSLVRPVDRWRRQVLRWSNAIYTTSVRLLPPDVHDRVTVVTNGVDIERFRPGSAQGGGTLRCVYASSFRAWHGAEHLVEAVRQCVEHGARLRVVCLGEGPRLGVAREAAGRARLTDVITFAGRVPFCDVPGYLAEADVGLAPFDPAAFSALRLGWFWSPIKIFEYLACGLPVVTIDIAELRSLLPDSVAWFYRPGDPGDLAAVIQRLASDPAVVARAGQAARRLAESTYSWDRQAAVVERVLQDVIARATPTSARR